MKVVQPITITPAMVVETNLFETAPAAYSAGTTYALGAYASVVGTLGEILIYKSLQAGNTGHTPSSSPTWWVYSSSTYGVYNPATSYVISHRVIDTTKHVVSESLLSANNGYPVDNQSSWKPVESAGRYDFTLPFYVGTTTYSAGTIVISAEASAGDINHITFPVFKSKLSGNTNHEPDTSPLWWQYVGIARPIYAPEATYTAGEVISDGKGNYYECLTTGIQGKPLTGYTAWLEISPTNIVALFDSQTQTKTIANKEITFTVASGIIDTVGLIGVNADMAVVTVRDGLGGTIVFQKTIGLTGGNPTNAWDYYFSEPTLRTTQTIIEGIPPYVNSHVTVTLTGSGIISIGNLIMGKSKEIGLVEYGASSGILDFSQKTTDSFGVTTFVQRGYKKTVNLRSFVENSKLNVIQNNLYSIRATPCLWVGSTDTRLSESLVVYGFYKDFNTEISYPTRSYITLEIEGLI